MIKKLVVLLIVSLCILSLSFHFIVEGLGGVHDHFIGHHVPGVIDSHDGDQFIVSEPGPSRTAQGRSHTPVPASLHQTSRPLSPLFHPPKSG